MRPTLLIVSIVALLFSSGCHQTSASLLLYRLQKDNSAQDAAVRRETENFARAKEALFRLQGHLQPYDAAQTRGVFGEPVTVFRRGGRAVWAYKPASSDWFSGEKIFLTFDSDGRLANAEYHPS